MQILNQQGHHCNPADLFCNRISCLDRTNANKLILQLSDFLMNCTCHPQNKYQQKNKPAYTDFYSKMIQYGLWWSRITVQCHMVTNVFSKCEKCTILYVICILTHFVGTSNVSNYTSSGFVACSVIQLFDNIRDNCIYFDIAPCPMPFYAQRKQNYKHP